VIITPKVQENITAVGKVTLHVWTSNWGLRPAAAAEALNKWDSGRAHRGEVGFRGYYPREICEDIQGGPKNWHHFFLYALTLPNINRFSKLFRRQNQEKICNNTVAKDPTTPQVCLYSTL